MHIQTMFVCMCMHVCAYICACACNKVPGLILPELTSAICKVCVYEYVYHVYISQSSGDGLTPLHMAAAHGHVAVVEELIRNGADANVRDRSYACFRV
jgi:hypothetical protein